MIHTWKTRRKFQLKFQDILVPKRRRISKLQINATVKVGYLTKEQPNLYPEFSAK
jgi:hypothetical protein